MREQTATATPPSIIPVTCKEYFDCFQPITEKDVKTQYGGQATLTNEVNGARDKPNFDFIELVYPKNVENKKIIIFLAPLMAEIEMVSIVVKRP